MIVANRRIAVCALAFAVATVARGEDRVVLAPLKPGGARVVLRGEIVEYRGDSLRVRTSADREDVFDPRRLLELETIWPAGLAAGDAAATRGEWDEALRHYRAAAAEDARGWVKRRLLARVVGVLRDARRPGTAGESFLALVRADAETPDFGVVPLAWSPSADETAAVEKPAGEWLERSDVPAAALLGASWSLTGPGRARALAVLKRLTDSPDPRVAGLAVAQAWRVREEADADELDRRRRHVAGLPDSLRPGPTWMLAGGLARAGRPRDAALEYLKLPILWGEQRELAARGLREAASRLETPDDRRAADGLYREIVANYPASSVADEARRKLAAP